MSDSNTDFPTEYAEGLAEFEKALIANASTDKAFREELLRDPRGVVRSELARMLPGVKANPSLLDQALPDRIEIKVVEQKADEFYLVLPPLDTEMDELSIDELEAVAGGGGLSDRTASPNVFACVRGT